MVFDVDFNLKKYFRLINLQWEVIVKGLGFNVNLQMGFFGEASILK